MPAACLFCFAKSLIVCATTPNPFHESPAEDASNNINK